MGSIILSVTVLAIGVAIGLLRGGRLNALADVRPRWWGLLLVGFAFQAIAESFDVPGAISLSVIGTFALIVGLGANVPAIRGAFVAAFGLTMNLLVMVANGAVPVRFEALAESGLVAETTTRAQVSSVGHLLELETADTRFAPLGDVVPIGLLSSVISIGDLVTFAGVIVIVSSLIAARKRHGVDVDELFAPAPVALGDVLDLDSPPSQSEPRAASQDPVIVLPDDTAIDLTQPESQPAASSNGATPAAAYDPDDLWADEADEGVQILGPVAKSVDSSSTTP